MSRYTLRFPDGLLAELQAEHERLYPGRREQSFNAYVIALIRGGRRAQKEQPK